MAELGDISWFECLFATFEVEEDRLASSDKDVFIGVVHFFFFHPELIHEEALDEDVGEDGSDECLVGVVVFEPVDDWCSSDVFHAEFAVTVGVEGRSDAFTVEHFEPACFVAEGVQHFAFRPFGFNDESFSFFLFEMDDAALAFSEIFHRLSCISQEFHEWSRQTNSSLSAYAEYSSAVWTSDFLSWG